MSGTPFRSNLTDTSSKIHSKIQEIANNSLKVDYNDMKTFKITFALSLCLLLAGIFAGCADKSHVRRRGDGTITLVLQAPAMESGNAMRQMSADQESAVSADKLYVLVFKTKSATGAPLDEPNEEYAYTAKVASVTRLTDKNQYEAKIRLKADDASTPYRLVLITNCDFDPADLSVGMTKAQVFAHESLKKAFTDKWPTDANARIPMWGESNTQRIEEGVTFGDCKDASSTNKIHLVRSLARVDVGLNFGADFTSETATPNGQTPFKLQSVRVYRMATSFMIPGTQSNTFHMDGTTKKPLTVLPDGVQMAADANPLVFDQVSDPEKATVREIYIPERLKGSNRTDRPCLVIGGVYGSDTKPTYYRLDFIKKPTPTSPKDKAEALDILRNHRYRFNITKVTGPGSDSPEDALITEPINIAFDVVVWNDGEIGEIRYDGQYYLAVTKDRFAFGKNGAAESFKIRTNWPQGYKIVDAAGNEMPKSLAQADNASADRWLYFTEPTGQSFAVDTYMTETLTVLDNPGQPRSIVAPATAAEAVNNPGSLFVQAGRIKWPLGVTQSDKVELSIKVYLKENDDWKVDCAKDPIDAYTCLVNTKYHFWVKYTENSKLGRIALDRDEQFKWTRISNDQANGIALYEVEVKSEDLNDEDFWTSEISKFRAVKDADQVETDFTVNVEKWDAIPYKDATFRHNMLKEEPVYTLAPYNRHFYIRANAPYTLTVKKIDIKKISGTPAQSEVVKGWQEGKIVDDKLQPSYAEGEEVLFRSYDYLKGTDKNLGGKIISAHITLKLEPKAQPGQDGYFTPKEFKIHFVAGIIQPEANTYVVEAGQIPILIPCSQINKAHDWMAQYKDEIARMIKSRVGITGGQAMSQAEYENYVAENGTWGELATLSPTETNWQAKPVWSTLTPTGNESGLEDVHPVNIDIAGRNYIYVKPKDEWEGCALVSAIKNGKIIWNWTIWVVKKKANGGHGYPWDDGDNQTYSAPYMNRNLGAYGIPSERSTTYYDRFFNDMCGLYYRHGTPIPHHAYDIGTTPQKVSLKNGAPHCTKAWYDRTLVPDQKQTQLRNNTWTGLAAALHTLNELIQNPTGMARKDALAENIIEFGSNEISSVLGKSSWQGGDGLTVLNNEYNFRNFKFGTQKTPFDPSPYGWKVPAAGSEAVNMTDNPNLAFSMTGAYINGNIGFSVAADANGVILHLATCYSNSDMRLINYYDNSRSRWFFTNTGGAFGTGDVKNSPSGNYNIRCIENEAESDYRDYTQDAVLHDARNATRAVFRSRR